MAKARTSVPPALKRKLVDEAGGKCANPGCTSQRTHIHHIERWAVYQTHDGRQMVALCPTCHDAVHHGPLEITDDTIRRWKAVRRSRRGDHIYVDPGDSSKLLLGSIAVTGQGGVTAFDLGDSQKLSFRLEDTDVMLMNLAVRATTGEELLRIVDGHLRHAAEEPVRYQRVPGHVRLTAPATDKYVQKWALRRLRMQEPDFAVDGRLSLLDIEVLEPGLVRVQGVWSGDRQAVAITATRLLFLLPDLAGPITLIGDNKDQTVIWHGGPITSAIFGVGGSSGTIQVGRQPAPSLDMPNTGRNDPCWCGSGRKFKKCHGA